MSEASPEQSRDNDVDRPLSEVNELGARGASSPDSMTEFNENHPPAEIPELLVEDYSPTASQVVELRTRSDVPSPADRRYVTVWLLVFVGLGMTAVFLSAIFGSADQWTRVERASTIVLTPLFTLLGTAVGWFFGHRTHR